ncbi:MAG: exo-alpha-sialidase [Calditrichaeota bacterium]|nr:exo-alpha-sialidase [Calditrichota bacterium]
MVIRKITAIILFFVISGISSNILAQNLKIYEDHIDFNKLYKQGAIIYLNENNDIRIYSSSNHQTENSVAINPVNPNNIIISTNGRVVYDENGNFVTVHQPYFYTLDGGITWNGSENNPNGIYSRGDPVVFFDVSGNAYYVTLGNPGGIYVLKSTDGGATWGATVNADSNNSYGDDKEHAIADISGTYPNNIYVVWKDFNTPNNDIIFTRSTNNGSSFGNRITLYAGLSQGANIAIGPNGEVYVAFAVYSSLFSAETGIKFTKSTDGGQSFSSAKLAFPITGIGYTNNGIPEFNNTRANSFPSMEVYRSDGSRRGWIYIVYADKNTGDSDIYLRRSTDGGTTWSNAIRVNSDQVGNGKQQWFPSIDVDEITGIIYVSYYNMDSIGFLTSRYVAISYDGGNTFKCIRISDVRFTPTELGAGYHDGYMGDYYETAVYNSKLFATWSDNREGNFQAYISLGVIANQYLSDNSTEVGEIGHWETSQFVDYLVPAHFEFSSGETHVLRGTQSIFSNEKYYKWNYDNNIKNFRSFDISPNTNELISYLEPTYSGVVIRNELISAPGRNLEGDSIYFKDPWLIDYPDPAYGNNLRNRGMDNYGDDKLDFKKRPSPFIPDFTTSYNGYVYQGVFLEQAPDPNDPNKPYYSVKAEAQQPFTAHGQEITGYFLNWEGTSVDFEHPSNQETAVVFHANNAEARAVYKGHLASNRSRATGYNNGRRIAIDVDGTMHLVYEDNNKIFYTKSTNNGYSWTKEEKIPFKFSGGNPSIAISYGQPGEGVHVNVVWETFFFNDYDQEVHAITYSRRTSSGWDPPIYISEGELKPNGRWTGPDSRRPSIYAEGSDYLFVAWNSAGQLKIINHNSYGQWSNVTNIPNAHNGYPEIVLTPTGTERIRMVWADNGNIKYIGGEYSGNDNWT